VGKENPAFRGEKGGLREKGNGVSRSFQIAVNLLGETGRPYTRGDPKSQGKKATPCKGKVNTGERGKKADRTSKKKRQKENTRGPRLVALSGANQGGK